MKCDDSTEEKYFAFISYSTKDNAEAKRLHHKLEYFKVTSSQAAKNGWKRKPLNPTFFAPYEIQPNGLTDELKLRLRNSKKLIVVCSPNSAQSQWVQWEINYFVSLGRKDRIYLFIVDGVPNTDNPGTDCYGSALKENGLSDILGANIHERVFKLPYLNRERAYIQLITKMLGIEFDTVWQRHKRQIRAKVITAILISILIVLSVLGAIHLSSSYDVKINFIKAQSPDLYEGDGSLKIILENDTITQKIDNTDNYYTIKNIPGKYRHKRIRCEFNMFGYNVVDTMVQLSIEGVDLYIQRIPDTYGHIEGQVLIGKFNLTPAHGAKISLNQTSVYTDSNGNFTIDVPIDLQNSDSYDATVQYGDESKEVQLYPMRHNPNINNLIIIE